MSAEMTVRGALRIACVAALVLACPHDAFAGVDHTHARFDRVLAAHVRDGLVDYAALKTEAADPESDFTRYLDELRGEGDDETTWTRPQRLAYWVNAYNAFTLELIADNYPIHAAWYMWVFPFARLFVPANSILMIDGRWDEKTFDSVRGPITLDTIEHGILRGEIGDPRIHFAIVCASIGCPELRARAYHPAAIDDELNEAARRFVTDPTHVRLESDGDLRVSKIFEWFRGDFDAPPPAGAGVLPDTRGYGEEAGVARWLATYGDDALRARIASGPPGLGHLDYDWSLNEQPTD